jgi:hypothetical protein
VALRRLFVSFVAPLSSPREIYRDKRYGTSTRFFERASCFFSCRVEDISLLTAEFWPETVDKNICQ